MAAKKSVTTRRKKPAQWLLLVHQLPPKPAYLRVKVWRRLQSLGAIALKNSVYALPLSEQSQEDFQWLLQEIRRDGGDGMVCNAELVDGMRDDEVRSLFDRARDLDYAELAKSLRALKNSRNTSHSNPKTQLAKIKQRFEAIAARDYFGASGRLAVVAMIAELENELSDERPVSSTSSGTLQMSKGGTWVTRRGVHVDRIASAWLIKRFIDKKAKFRFVEEKSYRHKPGEIRFDMFRAEYTHVGDECTFEVLTRLLSRKDPALDAIAQIVHDIDLKDEKFGRGETVGLAHVMAGICGAHPDDSVRIVRGGTVLDDAYEQFCKRH